MTNELPPELAASASAHDVYSAAFYEHAPCTHSRFDGAQAAASQIGH